MTAGQWQRSVAEEEPETRSDSTCHFDRPAQPLQGPVLGSDTCVTSEQEPGATHAHAHTHTVRREKKNEDTSFSISALLSVDCGAQTHNPRSDVQADSDVH